VKVSVVVATCGGQEWADLAASWAVPSVEGQGADEVVVRHYPDCGVAEARNRAVEEATGDWVIHLDADDQLCDGYVDAMRAAHASVTGDALFVPALGLCDPDGVCLTAPRIPDWDRWPDLNCCVIGTMVPRALLLEVGGFPPDPVFEDYAAFLAMAARGARLVPVPDAVYCATRNPQGRNLAPLEVRQATYDAIRARFDMAAIPRNPPLVTPA